MVIEVPQDSMSVNTGMFKINASGSICTYNDLKLYMLVRILEKKVRTRNIAYFIIPPIRARSNLNTSV